MPTTHALLTFALSAVLYLLVPGATVTLVAVRTLDSGRLAGLSAALGAGTGTLVHALAAVAGLGALLAATPWALTTLQLAGAAYLVHLGVRQLRSKGADATHVTSQSTPTRPFRAFADGVLIDTLNPKTALFFIAILPQFVTPAGGPPGTQLIVFALCFVPLSYLVNTLYSLLTLRMSNGIPGASSARANISRGTGLVYLGVAAFAVLA